MRLFKFTIPFLIYIFHSGILKANCELSWVNETEKGQNWIHTIATYPSEPKHIYVAPKASGKKIEFSCGSETQLFCENLKRMTIDSKSCVLAKPIKIKQPKRTKVLDEAKLPTWQVSSCSSLSSFNSIAQIGKNKEMSFLEPYPLTPLEQKAISPDVERSFREIADLKKVKLSDYPSIEADLSKRPVKTFTFFTNAHLKESAVAEVQIAIKLSQIPGICEKGCKDPNRVIEFPLLLIKLMGKWKLFGNGMIGDCSAYNGASEATLEMKVTQHFGFPVHYIFYDTDKDGKPDVFQFSSRSHLPGSVTVYDLGSDGSIEVGGELCVKSIGACFPEPGC